MRAHASISHWEMWRLASGHHTAFPAACRLVLSATQLCTWKRSADPGVAQCADREETAPATTFALAPKRAPSSSAVRRTAALNSTCFLLFLLSSAKQEKKIIMWQTIVSERTGFEAKAQKKTQSNRFEFVFIILMVFPHVILDETQELWKSTSSLQKKGTN